MEENSVKIRLAFAAVCILALPLLFSVHRSGLSSHSAPSAGVALAGHLSVGGYYCECGTQDCICDPGELPGGLNKSSVQSGSVSNTEPATDTTSDPDLTTGALLVALCIALWLRLQ
jgi:hypothetical protein